MPSLTFQINPEYAKITEVVRGLFVSGVCALSPSIVKHYRIDAIINTTEEVYFIFNESNVKFRYGSNLWKYRYKQTNVDFNSCTIKRDISYEV